MLVFGGCNFFFIWITQLVIFQFQTRESSRKLVTQILPTLGSSGNNHKNVATLPFRMRDLIWGPGWGTRFGRVNLNDMWNLQSVGHIYVNNNATFGERSFLYFIMFYCSYTMLGYTWMVLLGNPTSSFQVIIMTGVMLSTCTLDIRPKPTSLHCCCVIWLA